MWFKYDCVCETLRRPWRLSKSTPHNSVQKSFASTPNLVNNGCTESGLRVWSKPQAIAITHSRDRFSAIERLSATAPLRRLAAPARSSAVSALVAAPIASHDRPALRAEGRVGHRRRERQLLLRVGFGGT